MSAIYMTNTNSTVVPAKTIIPNGINKAPGQTIVWFLNSAILKRPGYYNVKVNVTFTAAAAGDVTLTLQKNGENIPSFTGTETITTANTETRTISFGGLIRVLCHEGNPVITLFNDSDIEITTSNVAITIID